MKKMLASVIGAACVFTGIAVIAQDAPQPPPPPPPQAKSDAPGQPQPGMHQGKGPFQDMRVRDNMLLANLRIDNQAKYDELIKLKESNKEEYAKQLRQYADEVKAKMETERDATKELIAKYKEGKDPAVKEQLKSKIKAFHERMLKMQELKIQDAEKSIVEEKKELAEKKASIDATVEKRLEEMLNREGGKGPKGEKGDRPDKPGKPEKGDRPDKPGKPESE